MKTTRRAPHPVKSKLTGPRMRIPDNYRHCNSGWAKFAIIISRWPVCRVQGAPAGFSPVMVMNNREKIQKRPRQNLSWPRRPPRVSRRDIANCDISWDNDDKSNSVFFIYIWLTGIMTTDIYILIAFFFLCDRKNRRRKKLSFYRYSR